MPLCFGARASFGLYAFAAALALSLVACGEVGSGNSTLGDVGVAPDARDTGIAGDTSAPDAVSDAASDGDGGIGGDTSAPDAASDAVSDGDGGIGGDTSTPDAVSDGDGGIGGDTSAPDAVPDVTPDAIPDAIPDAVADITPDAIPDVTPQCLNASGCGIPANPCFVTTCVSGKCGLANAAAGAACDDADPCTDSDICTVGVCKGVFNGTLPACGGPSGCSVAKTVGSLPFVDAGTTTGEPNNFAITENVCPDADNSAGVLGLKGEQSSDVVYIFTPPANGAYTFSLAAGPDKADLVLALFSTVCPTPSGDYFCDVADDDIGGGGEFISAVLNSGEPYWLVIDGWAKHAAVDGAYELTVAQAPATETSCGDGKDNDGDGAMDCDDSDCELAPACEPNDVLPGALAFTEIMANPFSAAGAADENAGEWLEVRNTTTSVVKLDQIWLAYRSWDDGTAPPAAPTATWRFDTSASVNGGALAVLARSAESASNGGITFAVVYGQITIANSQNVRLQLIHPEWDGAAEPAAGMIIDSVDVPALTFTQADGASWQLTLSVAGSMSAATGNDDASAWCFTSDAAANEYTAGNFGTPGGANLLCGATTAVSYAIDVQPFLATKCAPCHTGTTPGTCSGSTCHSSIYSDSQKLSKTTATECKGKGYTVSQCMEARILSGSMPLGQGCGGAVADNAANAAKCITQSELAIFQQWIAEGTPP